MCGRTDEVRISHDDAPPTESCFWIATHGHAFVGAVVNVHVVRDGVVDADGLMAMRVEDDEVGITTDGDCAFTRVHAEQFGDVGGCDGDELLEGETSLNDATFIHDRHAIFDAGCAVGDSGEVILAEGLHAIQPEGAVVCANGLEFTMP